MKLIRLEKKSDIVFILRVTYKTFFGRTVKRDAILTNDYYYWVDTDDLFTSHNKVMIDFHLSDLQELTINT